MKKLSCYQLTAAIDRDGANNSGRKIIPAMLRQMANLLHNFAILPVDGYLNLIWLHNSAVDIHPQQRSQILLTAGGSAAVKALLEQTVNCMRYRFEKCEAIKDFVFDKLKHHCDITRLHVINKPSVSKEFNPDVLPGYFNANMLKAYDNNDFSDLDQFLSGINKPIAWSLSLKRYDTLMIKRLLARYCDILSAVNYGRIETTGFMASRENRFRFEKHRDPLADETRRNVSKLLSDSGDSAFSFTVRTFASSAGLAQLSAAVLAGCCLCDGTYDFHLDCADHAQAIKAVQSGEFLLPDISLKTDCPDTKTLYQDLKVLVNIASPNELSGFFRLPIASESFRPKSLMCDTDPPSWSIDEILPLGLEVIDNV